MNECRDFCPIDRYVSEQDRHQQISDRNIKTQQSRQTINPDTYDIKNISTDPSDLRKFIGISSNETIIGKQFDLLRLIESGLNAIKESRINCQNTCRGPIMPTSTESTINELDIKNTLLNIGSYSLQESSVAVVIKGSNYGPEDAECSNRKIRILKNELEQHTRKLQTLQALAGF